PKRFRPVFAWQADLDAAMASGSVRVPPGLALLPVRGLGLYVDAAPPPNSKPRLPERVSDYEGHPNRMRLVIGPNATLQQVLGLMESLMRTQPLLADKLIISYAGTTPWSPIDKAIPLARSLADRGTRAVLEVPADLLTEPPPAWPHHRPVDRKGRPTFIEATRAKAGN